MLYVSLSQRDKGKTSRDAPLAGTGIILLHHASLI